MSKPVKGIVHYLPELPKEGRIVYADNEPFSPDYATLEEGVFMSVADFPSRSREMTNVSKWYYMGEYNDHFITRGDTSWCNSFHAAEEINQKETT